MHMVLREMILFSSKKFWKGKVSLLLKVCIIACYETVNQLKRSDFENLHCKTRVPDQGYSILLLLYAMPSLQLSLFRSIPFTNTLYFERYRLTISSLFLYSVFAIGLLSINGPTHPQKQIIKKIAGNEKTVLTLRKIF